MYRPFGHPRWPSLRIHTPCIKTAIVHQDRNHAEHFRRAWPRASQRAKYACLQDQQLETSSQGHRECQKSLGEGDGFDATVPCTSAHARMPERVVGEAGDDLLTASSSFTAGATARGNPGSNCDILDWVPDMASAASFTRRSIEPAFLSGW